MYAYVLHACEISVANTYLAPTLVTWLCPVRLCVQAKLKAEYEKMERKLKEMESRLQDTKSGGNRGEARERVPASSSRSMNGSS